MTKSEELLKRVQYALKKWYTIPPVMATRVDMLPELHIKYRMWIGNLEQAVKDLQDELELQAKQTPSSLGPCPSCGSSEVGRMCAFMKPSERHARCFSCGTTMDIEMEETLYFSLKPCP